MLGLLLFVIGWEVADWCVAEAGRQNRRSYYDGYANGMAAGIAIAAPVPEPPHHRWVRALLVVGLVVATAVVALLLVRA